MERVVDASVDIAMEITEKNDIENNIRSETLAIQQSNGNAQQEESAAEPTKSSEENSEPALELLAKNLESIGNYKDMHNDMNKFDMIAFKVLTKEFEKSDYIIGLVECIIGKMTDEQQDYELELQIMGKVFIWEKNKKIKSKMK